MESNNKIILNVCKDIPNHESFIKIEAINKGVSSDAKYYVETVQGQRYLLRISNIESYERKKIMYDMMVRVASLGVSLSIPVDFGICNNGKNVYQLLTWCDGETADAVLPRLSFKEQYLLGVKAGQNLKKIHSIPAPPEIEDWYDKFVRVNDVRIRAFFNCGVHIDCSETILAFYEENRHLLHGRPQCFIHGDYHNDNLLITADGNIVVVDWDLIDDLYADPWWEFDRILNANLVPHFTTGQIHGYFDGEPPEEFWKILALYLSTGALMLVSWGVNVEPSFRDECIQTANSVIQWFDGMRNPMPNWYFRKNDILL